MLNSTPGDLAGSGLEDGVGKSIEELLVNLAEAGYTLIAGAPREPAPTDYRYSLSPVQDKSGTQVFEAIFTCKGFVPTGFTRVIEAAGNEYRIEGNLIKVRV